VPLKWSAPESDNGMPILDYVIQYSSDNGVSWTTFNDGASSSQYVPAVSGLADGTTYVFRVAATNKVGTGNFSSNSAPVQTFGVPSAPRSVKNSPVVYDRVALTWTEPESANGMPLLDYVIEYSLNNGNSWITFNDGVSLNKGTMFTGLVRGKTYLYRVSGKNGVGVGSSSAPISVRVP
jgi:Fibronectin type III domain